MKTCGIAVLLLLCSSCSILKHTETRDFSSVYDSFNVKGSFLLYDLNNRKETRFNSEQLDQGFLPCSTFKIINSLIALESGVASDENFLIPWDSVVRQNQAWNQDQTLKTAFKCSAFWYYQEIARRVGEERMKSFLEKADYGNKNTGGGIDRFWLMGDLRITPRQQLDFLKRFQSEKLPFSKRNMRLVKNIMLDESETRFKLYAKTGWGEQNGQDLGWYVGFIEKEGNTWFFVTCIQCSDQNNKQFAQARKEITFQILEKLGVI